MLIQKKQVLKMVKELPEKIDVEELMYRFYLWEKLEVAEKDLKAGRTLSHVKVVKETGTWFK